MRYVVVTRRHFGDLERDVNSSFAKALDYDLFAINPENKNTTPEQLWDCIYHALEVFRERTESLALLAAPTPTEISLCPHCYCMTHTEHGVYCAKCKERKDFGA